MLHRFNGWLLALTMIVVSSIVLLAQSAKQTTPVKSTPDLSGVWNSEYQPRDLNDPTGLGVMRRPSRFRETGTGGFGFLDWNMEQPSMTPWAEERYKVARKGIQDPYEHGPDAIDPMVNCLPGGIPEIYDHPAPFSIVQTPTRLMMHFETNNEGREIYLDGRPHPHGAPPSSMGHSTGKWEGDTLVVDTVNLDDLSWLDTLGHPHSDALHVVERIRRMRPDRLEIEFTFEDPKAYTKPWKGKKIFLLKADWEVMENFICEDSAKEKYLHKLSENNYPQP